MSERYSPKVYPNNPFRCYLAMRRYERVSDIFRFFLKQSRFVLDVGCGVGEYLKYAVDENRTVIGVDLDKSGLRNRNFFSVQSDAQNLPFKENVFDLVLFSEVLEHLSCPEKALDEIKRVTIPEGILIISTPSKKSIYEKQFLVFIVSFCIWVFQNITGREKNWAGDHISLQLPNELKDMLEKRGLKVMADCYTGFCLPLTGELLNFLFRFKFVRVLYAKLDKFFNRCTGLVNLNWSMIFTCKNCVYDNDYS